MGKLCWSCKEKWLALSANNAINFDLLHCHHEPKEKPDCWCKVVTNLIQAENFSITILGKEVRVTHCPQCGRKL